MILDLSYDLTRLSIFSIWLASSSDAISYVEFTMISWYLSLSSILLKSLGSNIKIDGSISVDGARTKSIPSIFSRLFTSSLTSFVLTFLSSNIISGETILNFSAKLEFATLNAKSFGKDSSSL